MSNTETKIKEIDMTEGMFFFYSISMSELTHVNTGTHLHTRTCAEHEMHDSLPFEGSEPFRYN